MQKYHVPKNLTSLQEDRSEKNRCMPLGHEEKYNESCTGGAKVPEATVIEVDLEVMLAVKVTA